MLIVEDDCTWKVTVVQKGARVVPTNHSEEAIIQFRGPGEKRMIANFGFDEHIRDTVYDALCEIPVSDECINADAFKGFIESVLSLDDYTASAIRMKLSSNTYEAEIYE